MSIAISLHLLTIPPVLDRHVSSEVFEWWYTMTSICGGLLTEVPSVSKGLPNTLYVHDLMLNMSSHLTYMATTVETFTYSGVHSLLCAYDSSFHSSV